MIHWTQLDSWTKTFHAHVPSVISVVNFPLCKVQGNRPLGRSALHSAKKYNTAIAFSHFSTLCHLWPWQKWKKVGIQHIFLILKNKVLSHYCVRIFICCPEGNEDHETFLCFSVGKMFNISLTSSMEPKYSDLISQWCAEISYSLIMSSADELNSASWQDICCKNLPEFFGIQCVARLLCCLETVGLYVGWHSKHLTVASVRVRQRR